MENEWGKLLCKLRKTPSKIKPKIRSTTGCQSNLSPLKIIRAPGINQINEIEAVPSRLAVFKFSHVRTMSTRQRYE